MARSSDNLPAMLALTVNTGSSSLRVGAFELAELAPRALASQRIEGGSAASPSALRGIVRALGLERVDCVVHRLVHGGATLTEPRLIDSSVEGEIERLSPLAPLHNPRALAWIRVARELFGPALPQIAVFDTAFFATLPKVAADYPLPRELSRRLGLRRFGFHGLAHQFMSERWRTLRPGAVGLGRLITLQLGSGCSAAAISDGRPLDTSMGFTPLEGLPMATRCGDLDPGIVLHLQRELGWSAERIGRLLDEESGLLGLSGTSGDLRDLEAEEARDDRARHAIDLFCFRVRKYVGAYLAVLGGADAILFGGGVGEHLPRIRGQILGDLGALGIELDHEENRLAVGIERRISHASSRTEVWVTPVREDELLARAAWKLLRN
jgi:acetate kinase